MKNSAADADVAMEGFISERRSDISVDTWIRMEQMTGALAWIRLPAVHLMIFLTGFQMSAVLLTE